MPSIETTIEFSELLGYAQDAGICTWNEACNIIYPLYPTDGEGSTYIYPQEYESGDYGNFDPRLVQILVGFAKLYEDEYKTYSGGFTAILD